MAVSRGERHETEGDPPIRVVMVAGRMLMCGECSRAHKSRVRRWGGRWKGEVARERGRGRKGDVAGGRGPN